jgi:diaminopimelate decarboxylase
MKQLPLFPITTTIQNDQLHIANINLKQLANEYSTPLYVYDRATLDQAVIDYKTALASFYPQPASVTYAGKAYLSIALAQWTQLHNITLDCTGEGEIHIAVSAKVKRENILVHGVNKSESDLKSAIQHAGTIVVDNLSELKKIQLLLQKLPTPNYQLPSLWLRLLPGVTVTTHHAHTQTGHQESKFGMTHTEIQEAVAFCKENHLPINGIHFHQGSNFRDPEPLIPAIDFALDIAKEVGFQGEWFFCPGGGWGVAYHEDELPHPSIELYVKGICEAVLEGCKHRDLALPHLQLEPGRNLVARAGVAIYEVGAVKQRENKTWILVNGGMADNVRYAMYGARYSCLAVSNVTAERGVLISVAGPYCESGDVIFEDVQMSHIQAGDLIAVPVSGAYHLSMASNYNGARKPAVLLLEDGKAKLIQRRETLDDLLRRDVSL